MARQKRMAENWFWELCECREHGRLVLEGRTDFSTEWACIADAAIMLDAIKEGIDAQRLKELWLEIRRSPLPKEELGISPELREPLRQWNEVWGNAMEAETSLLDPIRFHDFAGRLAGTNEATKH